MMKKPMRSLDVTETSLIIQASIEGLTPGLVLCRDELVRDHRITLEQATDFVQVFSDAINVESDIVAWLDRHGITDVDVRECFIKGTVNGFRNSLIEQIS